MIIHNCIHNISDDDCERCEVHPYQWHCGGCKDYSHTWEGDNEVIQDKCSGCATNGTGTKD